MSTLSEVFARDGFAVDEIRIGKSVISVSAEAVAECCSCPRCHRRSHRVHSRYVRTLKDLPVAGRRLRVTLTVRKWFCDNKRCRQRVFCERLPGFLDSYARSTRRMNEALCGIGHFTGAEAGARLAKLLSMPASGDTILRRLHRSGNAAITAPRVIGVDDWAYRKGQTYGTIICDLERRCPIDLFPGRTSESLASWLRAHKGVRFVSRDRAGCYSRGIQDGAPAAVQVADRWHLLKNARDVLKRIADRCHRETCQIRRFFQGKTGQPAFPQPPAARSGVSSVATVSTCEEHRRSNYQEVLRLHAAGMSQRKIAARIGLNRSTVAKYIASGGFPARPAKSRASAVDLHDDYLRQRWHDGCHNASQLYTELKAAGFRGSYYSVRRHIQPWRQKMLPSQAPRKRLQAPSSSRIAWLLLTKNSSHSKEDRVLAAALRKASPTLKSAARILQDFVAIVRDRKMKQFAAWLSQAIQPSQPAEVRRFAAALKSDKAAVEAALKHRWSNGQVEGQINRLKTIKRQMYGRASFELLRRRVLNFRP